MHARVAECTPTTGVYSTILNMQRFLITGCRQARPNSATRRTCRRSERTSDDGAQKEKTIVRGHTCFKFEKSHGAPVPNATENQMRGKLMPWQQKLCAGGGKKSSPKKDERSGAALLFSLISGRDRRVSLHFAL
jgi:hypothetical protein